VIGDVNNGWHVAVTTLMNERSSLGSSGSSGGESMALRLAKLARDRGTLDALTRQRIVDIWIRTEIGRYLGMRTLTAALRGGRPGPEGSVGKLASTKLAVDTGVLAVDILGAAGVAGDEFKRWQTRFVGGPGWRLGGGTDEVNRNIIAERVLGLPSEPSDYELVPWRDLPR
jgi:alkylation response protein AidB-like acyl-CoA dehydrogenase